MDGSARQKSEPRLTTRAAEFLVNMAASADVLAMAKVEVDLAAIPEGKNVCTPAGYDDVERVRGTHG